MSTGDPSSVDPRRLAMLLGPTGKGREWRDAELEALLKLQLDRVLRTDGPAQTLADLFTGPNPPVEELVRIKNAAKAARELAGGPLPESIASVLYFTAIAVALVRCGRRISTLPDAALVEGIEWALNRGWLAGNLRATLNEAREYLDKGGSGNC